MGNFIQIDPRMFDTGRGPRRSTLVGQALGGTIQNLANSYLQSKVQSMLDEKKMQNDLQVQQDSAMGLAGLAPVEVRPQIIASFSKLPISMHTPQNLKTAIELTGGGGQDFITSGFEPESLGRKMPTMATKTGQTGPYQTTRRPTEERIEQPMTPQKIATNMAALQRMGQGGLPMMPGVPQGQNFLPYEQQYQPAMGNAPGMAMPQQMQPGQPPVMSTGEVAPKPGMAPLQETRAAPLPAAAAAAPTPEEQGRVALEDVTPEEMNRFLRTSKETPERKREIKKAWDAVQRDKREERTVEALESKVKGTEKERVVKRADEHTKAFRDEISKKSSSIGHRQQAIDITRDAIKRGNMGHMSIAHIADMFGMQGADAKQLQSGVKTLIISGLSPIGGKQNVYLEQMMAGSLPQIGSTQNGNLISIDSAQSALDIDQAYVDTFNELNEKYLDDPKYGYLPEKAVREFDKLVKPKLEKIRDNTMLKLQEDREFGMSEQDMFKLSKQSFPTPLTDKKQDALIDRAKWELKKARPGKEPSPDEVMRYAMQLAKNNNYIYKE